MNWRKFLWPAIGSAAVIVSMWLLYHELRGLSVHDVWVQMRDLPVSRYVLAAAGACVAYAALAGYDHIALLHIGKRVSFLFVTLCSFTTYALSHNIGGSVFSGAVVRYRAYSSRGLTAQDVGVLVAFCWFTFILSTAFTSSIVLLLEPDLGDRFGEVLPPFVTTASGVLVLLLVGVYAFASRVGFRPLKIGKVELAYPKLPIVLRQLTIGPLELIGAGAVLYFALPEAGNPGYVVVLGVFIVAFSLAAIAHAPGGIGVFEYVAIVGLSDMDEASVMAALVIFRIFYLIVPLIIALIVVIVFERGEYGRSEPPVDQPGA